MSDPHLFNWRRITFQYCDGFAIHQYESALVYLCPLHPELTSYLPPYTIPRAVTEHWPWCLLHALVICFTYNNVCVSMLFHQVISPSPPPTESKVSSFHLWAQGSKGDTDTKNRLLIIIFNYHNFKIKIYIWNNVLCLLP